MNNILIILLMIFCQALSGQEHFNNMELLDLAQIYKKNHVMDPTDEVFLKLDAIKSENLQDAKFFIGELILNNNSIATTKYLIKPDSTTLWSLYLVKRLTWNMFDFNSVDPTYGLDSLMNQNIDFNEQLANYYSMMFTSVLNKNRPFDMSAVNFDFDLYNLSNTEEKGIFFLESMETFGTLISGYFRVKPPNYEKANDFISKYPKFNGNDYYKYLNLDFEDFNFTFSKTKPKGSYKEYQINKYLNTILCNAICLSQDKEKVDELNIILSNSIISDENFWKYSESPETYRQIYERK